MLIIVEGVDGTGKSTLVKELVKYGIVQVPPEHYDTFPDSKTRLGPWLLLNYMTTYANSDKICVCDRSALSDILYRVFDEHKSVISMHEFYTFCNSHNVVTIWCDTKDSEKQMLDRGDTNPVAIQRHKELKNLYEIAMAGLGKVIKYDFTYMNYKDVLNMIMILGGKR